jgi:hypothetical protein
MIPMIFNEKIIRRDFMAGIFGLLAIVFSAISAALWLNSNKKLGEM